MKDCIEYVNYLKKMIRISDQNFKMNLNNHTLCMMFQLEKSKYKDQLKELKKSNLFNQCMK